MRAAVRSSTMARIRARSSGVGQPQRRRRGTRATGVVAAGPAEDEVDGRAAGPRSASCSTTSTPARRGEPAPAAGRAGGARRRQRRRRRAASASGLGRPSTSVGSRCSCSAGAVAGQVEVHQLDRAAAPRCTVAVGPRTVVDPVGQLLGVRHRGRQAHSATVARQVDDHLLPHRAAVGVLEVVDLVEDDEARARRSAGDPA